jgi:hypothetical protein
VGAAAKMAESTTADGITNVQTAGVDEGGIVKRAGDFLVVLRRGRLFTVRVGSDALDPVAMTDAYAPNADPRGAWYDELLVSGSTVVVVGYSYARGGTEIGLFELDPRGGLSYRATYHLRSFDYFSARNYASRLIGRQLVFYSPTLLQPGGPHPLQMMPGLRRWTGAVAAPADASWQRILPATRIHRSDDDFDPSQPLALHTITRCELGAATLDCDSTAVLGPAGRVFYVSQSAVYVWTAGRAAGRAESSSAVFRIPLDGRAPSGLKTVGVPIDQLSFLEDAQGHLNVLLRAGGAGEGMWGQQGLQGDTALLRLPLSALGDGRGPRSVNTTAACRRSHRRRTASSVTGCWWAVAGLRAGPMTAVPPLGLGPALRRPPVRGPAAGPGPCGGAHRSPGGPCGAGGQCRRRPALQRGAPGRWPGPPGRPPRAGRCPAGRDPHARLLLPADRRRRRSAGSAGAGPAAVRGGLLRGAAGAASVLFLREQALDFRPLGSLQSRGGALDDGCKASCVDWYGNARPLFVGDRVFALLGYELVEGRLDGRGGAERIDERRRASFAPRPARAEGGRFSPFTP